MYFNGFLFPHVFLNLYYNYYFCCFVLINIRSEVSLYGTTRGFLLREYSLAVPELATVVQALSGEDTGLGLGFPVAGCTCRKDTNRSL